MGLGGGISAWFCWFGGSFFQFCLIENLANSSPKIAKFMEFSHSKKKIFNFVVKKTTKFVGEK